ncbi:hypothetical protein NC651_021257 [Populus alba x Populus x berolinensis]|nr:hypothetical protein NC651_021257 [Populus alba x Populus x berolinensis]
MLLYKDRNCACAPDRPATFIRSDESDVESVRYKETEYQEPIVTFDFNEMIDHLCPLAAKIVGAIK